MGVPLPLGPKAPLLRITAGQLEAMAASGALAALPRIELRDGVLCQMNPQYRPHLLAKTHIYDAFRDALRAQASPLGVASEGSVRISEHELPMPDILVWDVHPGTGPVPVEHVRLVVEIADTTLEDDLGRKRLLYAAGQIPEYWVIDLPNQTAHKFWSPTPTNYTEETTIPFGQPLPAATLPGLTIDTTPLQPRT